MAMECDDPPLVPPRDTGDVSPSTMSPTAFGTGSGQNLSSPSSSASASVSAIGTATSSSLLFDLETYISRYDPLSETRLQRLLFIARRGGGGGGGGGGGVVPGVSAAAPDDVCKLAYELAERQMKETGNVRRYREVFYPRAATGGGGGGQSGRGSASSGGIQAVETSVPSSSSAAAAGGSGSGEAAGSESTPESTPSSSSASAANTENTAAGRESHPSDYGLSYDSQFVAVTEQSSALHLEALEARLTTAQAHFSKEAIRNAYLALAEHHRRRGELREAMKKLLRSRDFCTNNRQTGQVCLQVIELGIDARNLNQVRDYVSKARHTSDLMQSDPLFASKLRVASALASLSDSKYEDAARTLASVSADLTNQFNTVVSAEDIASYGALLGLATLDRSELRSLLLDGPNFKGRLELVPPLRDALRHCVRAEYGPCLSLLSALKPELALDLHLAPHANALLDSVRDRCVVQYFAPYTRVSLQTVANVFDIGGASVDEAERIVAGLIRDGKIRNARIDSIERTLRSEGRMGSERRRREKARARVARLGRTFVAETEGMILRLSCLENDLVVQGDVVGGGRGGKVGAWRGGGRMRGRGGGGGGGGYDAGSGIRYDVDSSDEDELVGETESMDIDVGLV